MLEAVATIVTWRRAVQSLVVVFALRRLLLSSSFPYLASILVVFLLLHNDNSSLLSVPLAIIYREIEGVGDKDRPTQGSLFPWRSSWSFRTCLCDWWNQTVFGLARLHLPCIHVVQGLGGGKDCRRRCYPMDDVLDRLLLFDNAGIDIPFPYRIRQVLLPHQMRHCRLLVPSQDCWCRSYLQLSCPTVHSSTHWWIYIDRQAGGRRQAARGKEGRVKTVYFFY